MADPRDSAEKGALRIGDDNPIRAALADHFIMWHELDDLAGPSGEWRCQCGLKFGFSDSAIDHVAREVIRILPPAEPRG